MTRERLDAAVFRLPVGRSRRVLRRRPLRSRARVLLRSSPSGAAHVLMQSFSAPSVCASGPCTRAYPIGALLRGETDFTAATVGLDGRPCAKKGRERWPNERLEPPGWSLTQLRGGAFAAG